MDQRALYKAYGTLMQYIGVSLDQPSATQSTSLPRVSLITFSFQQFVVWVFEDEKIIREY